MEEQKKLNPEEREQWYNEFIKAQVEEFKKNNPNALTEKVPDGFKRKTMRLLEQIEKYKASPEYKRLIAKYNKKFADLKKEKEQIAKRQAELGY